MSTQTYEVEAYRCWDDHTWDTTFVHIPCITSDLQGAVEAAVMAQLKNSADLPCMVGPYHVPDDENNPD